MKKNAKLFLLVVSILLLVCSCTSKTSEGTATNEVSTKTLTGTWIIDFSQPIAKESDLSSYEFLHKFRTNFLHYITFYDDGTYSATYDNIREFTDIDSFISPEEKHGNYSIVHDGTSLSFDDSEYYTFELSGDVLAIWSSEDEKYVYNRNTSINDAGDYLVSSTLEGEELSLTLTFREDHLIEMYDINGIYTIMDRTWKIEDNKLVVRSVTSWDLANPSSYEFIMDVTFNSDGFVATSEGESVIFEKVTHQKD